MLTDYDKLRYQRQMSLTGWDQNRLKEATVFIAGAGGLGSPVAIYLAVAGVGNIHLCDMDKIELSNLNRQILHPDARIGQLKVQSAKKTVAELNPTLNITAHADYLDESNIDHLVGQPDIIVDCLDNYETRYLLNQYCYRHHIPLAHGAIWGLAGQMTFIHPPETPCLRCLVPEAPPSEVFPVVGATPGVIGSLQAMETLKYLTGLGETLQGRLLLFDGEEMTFMEVETRRDPACPVCGART